MAGVPTDAGLISWTLAVFELSAAAGGLTAGWAARRVRPARVAASTLGAAPLLLGAALAAEPGSLWFFAITAAAGATANAAVPLLIIAAQDRAPHAVAAASGMLMGLANGVAGITFVAVGVLADIAGLTVALTAGFAAALPAAVVAGRSLRHRPTASRPLTLVPAGRCGGCDSSSLTRAA